MTADSGSRRLEYMVNSNRKGELFRSGVAEYMRSHGFANAHRYYDRGAHVDLADIANLHDLVIECKNQQKLDLADWMEQMLAARDAAGASAGAVVHKRRSRGIGDAYATLPFSMLCELLVKAGYGD